MDPLCGHLSDRELRHNRISGVVKDLLALRALDVVEFRIVRQELHTRVVKYLLKAVFVIEYRGAVGARELLPLSLVIRGKLSFPRLAGLHLGLPTRLREFDLSLDEMIEVAGAARSFDMMNYLPRVVSTEDIYELIKSAF